MLSYVASGLAAATLLSWAIGAKNAALMVPVLVAVAYGFTAGLRGRRWDVGMAAALGALAALAVATSVVHAFALFPFLDSKL